VDAGAPKATGRRLQSHSCDEWYVGDLDVAIDAYGVRYVNGPPKFRKDAAQYIYLGIGRFELGAMPGTPAVTDRGSLTTPP
jgi:hypothetical protein